MAREVKKTRLRVNGFGSVFINIERSHLMDLLQEASILLKERASLVAKLREKDEQIRLFCRKYEEASGHRGLSPAHLSSEIAYQLKKANQ